VAEASCRWLLKHNAQEQPHAAQVAGKDAR